MSHDDWTCNTEVLQIFFKLCDEAEKSGAKVTGDSTTKDGRIIAYARWPA